MRLPGWRRTDPDHTPPPEVLAVLAESVGPDRVLASARSDQTWLLATTHRFAAVFADGTVRWLRPWHEVDAASWGRESETLTVTFVDGGRPTMLPMASARTFLMTLRERVQASVVASVDLPLEGARKARAVIRQNLATGEPHRTTGPWPRHPPVGEHRRGGCDRLRRASRRHRPAPSLSRQRRGRDAAAYPFDIGDAGHRQPTADACPPHRSRTAAAQGARGR